METASDVLKDLIYGVIHVTKSHAMCLNAVLFNVLGVPYSQHLIVASAGLCYVTHD